MAYNDLQEYLTRLEAAGKLHWIEQRVDPSWEVSAITRHSFDRYGWNDRPALGFRQVGVSEFPLVIGVIGGSPEIYALALSTTVDKIPEVWERGQRHPIDPVIAPTGLCKEIILHSSGIDLGSPAPGGLDTEPGSRTVYHRAGDHHQRCRDRQAQRRHLPAAVERR